MTCSVAATGADETAAVEDAADDASAADFDLHSAQFNACHQHLLLETAAAAKKGQ